MLQNLKTPSPTVFDSLNARQLSPTQVASSFIPSEHFAELVKRTHNVVIGPRGSGKTTLFKMLQVPALDSWRHPDAQKYIGPIDYVTAFIPADVSWQSQWNIVSASPIEKLDALKEAVFLSHTIRSILDAFDQCRSPTIREGKLAHLYIELSRQAEVDLVNYLSQCLSIMCHVPTLIGLQLALRARMAQIGYILNGGNITKALPDFVHLEFASCISAVIEGLNSFSGRPNQVWALAFDELEIAPETIRSKLLALLRSTDQRILFKLSMAPYARDFELLNDPDSPSAGNDFIPINLWYSHKEHARPFSRSLFDQVCLAHGLVGVTPLQVFGPSEFDPGSIEPDSGVYSPGSPRYTRLVSLSKKDPTFAAYLRRKKVNLNRLEDMDESDRASAVRKVINLVTVRESFRSEDGALRSRKNPSLYNGATSLFDLTEGNPRVFLALIVPLIKKYSATSQKVKSNEQNLAVANISNRFVAMLSTIPFEQFGKNVSNFVTLNDLLDVIGNYFFQRIVKDDFTPDPPITFIVDQQVPEAVVNALGIALNVGAIVYMVDDPGKPLLETIRGKRFRLNHLLAPKYKLPLTASKSRTLSNILMEVTPSDGLLFNFDGEDVK